MSKNDIVYVEIIGSPDRYTKRSEELGYKVYDNAGGKYLILYSGPKVYNVLTDNFNYKQMSEEEFFGVEKVRTNLEVPVLEVLVNLVCDGLSSFSSFDVTSMLRKRLPSVNIKHEEVKTAVEKYVSSNTLQVNDNGTYKVYCKQPKVKNMIKTCSNQPLFFTTSYPLNITSGTSASQIVKPVSKLEELLAKKRSSQKLANEVIVPVLSEGRVSVKGIVNDNFKSVSNLYVTRSPSKITISPFATFNSSHFSPNDTFRFRTGFKTNKAKVIISSDKLEIVPSV